MSESSSEADKMALTRALDARVEALDGEVLERLRRARRQAARQADRSVKPWFPPAGLHWAAGVAAFAVLAVGLGFWWQAARQPLPAALDDLDVLAGSEDLNLVRDLDFYLWLEQDAALDEGQPALDKT